MSIKLYVEAIKQWGIDSQLDMLTEEAAELIAAVNKYRRSNGKIKYRIAEEIADTKIMIEEVMLGLNLYKQVDKYMGWKLKRLEKRLKK